MAGEYQKVCWAVVPNDWRTQNQSPYVLTEGMKRSDLNWANWASRILKSRGVRCHVELREESC